MAPSNVLMFNASVSEVTVMVNNGTSFTIAGTSAALSYYAQNPAVAPPFSPTAPASGEFGLGANAVSITPSNSVTPAGFSVTIPSAIQLFSLQLFVFWSSNESVTWVLLNDGECIGWSGASDANR